MKRAVLATILFLVAAGCETTTDDRSADRVAGEAINNGVRVITRAERWPGMESISDKVTPLVVSIENNSDAPVNVRYGQLSLTMPDGTKYDALPPFRMANTPRGPEAVIDFTLGTPAFEFTSFEIAPYFRAIFPDVAVYDGIFIFNPLYHGRKYSYWENTGLPTKEMLRLALPEGVVHPGGRLVGWVYFERVPASGQTAVLRSEFMSTDSGRRVALVRVPLE